MARFSQPYGAFEIDSLPGQSQVAVCHSFVVPEKFRGKGYGHQLKRQQVVELDAQHYDFALCTVAAGNERQKRVLADFRNRRSSETTELWCRGTTYSVPFEDHHHE